MNHTRETPVLQRSRGVPRRRAWAPVGLALCAAVAVTACGRVGFARPGDSTAGLQVLVTSIRAEPRSLNRYVARDLSTEVVTLLTHATLVRTDRLTQQLEPRLAERWELLPDQLTYPSICVAAFVFQTGSPSRRPTSSSPFGSYPGALYRPRKRRRRPAGPIVVAIGLRSQCRPGVSGHWRARREAKQ